MVRKSLALALIGAISVAAAFFVLQFLPVHGGDALYDRVLLFSRLQFRVEPDGATHYVPNADVREIGVYNGRLEYDIRYRTNNLGLIDHQDYADGTRVSDNQAAKHYAFVGDSFTAGSGGGPWVPLLRDRLVKRDPSYQIYNLGVAGTGAVQFEKLLTNLSGRLKFKHIFILAISDDLNRMPWRILQTQDELRFCGGAESDERCLSRPSMAAVIDYDAAPDKIERRVASLRSGNAPLAPPSKPGPFYRIKWLVKRALNFRALRKIRKQFPDATIVFVHLPQREEVLAGKYSENLRERIEGMGMGYFAAMECGWSRDWFLPNDPHPNRRGYEGLSACLEQKFFGL